MAVGGGEVDQAPLSENVNSSAVGKNVFIDKLAHAGVDRLGDRGELIESDLDVEVPRVTNHRAIFHEPEMLASDDVDVTCHRDE